MSQLRGGRGEGERANVCVCMVGVGGGELGRISAKISLSLI